MITLLFLWAILDFTRIGNAILSVAQDREVANLMGIDVSRISMITMVISGALACVAGAAVAPIFMINPLMWRDPLVLVLAAVVLGGMGSLKGCVIAAFILGFAETAVVFLIPNGGFLKGAVSLTVMVLVLIFKPEGLYGVMFEEERL
jgi:branched-chain amino acid transport system permease protein